MTIYFKAIRPRHFNVIDPAKTDREARAGIREYLEDVKRQLQEYPPEHEGQAYVRTFRLHDSWRVRLPSRYYGELTNDMHYAGLVQGRRHEGGKGDNAEQQTRFRNWGWRSITDVTRETARNYPEIMNRRLKSALGSRN